MFMKMQCTNHIHELSIGPITMVTDVLDAVDLLLRPVQLLARVLRRDLRGRLDVAAPVRLLLSRDCGVLFVEVVVVMAWELKCCKSPPHGLIRMRKVEEHEKRSGTVCQKSDAAAV